MSLFRKAPKIPDTELANAVKAAMSSAFAYARSHGGEIELVDVTADGDVHLRMHGSCRFCPIADVTLKLGVEEVLRREVPGIRKVIRLR